MHLSLPYRLRYRLMPMNQIYEDFLLHPNNKVRIPRNPTTLAAYRLLIRYPTPLSTSASPYTPLSSLNYTTTMPTAAAQSSVKTNNPAQPPPTPRPRPPPPPPPPAVPDKFKILVLRLKSHSSKGIIRPLRSQIAVEITRNGTTYRQAGSRSFVITQR